MCLVWHLHFTGTYQIFKRQINALYPSIFSDGREAAYDGHWQLLLMNRRGEVAFVVRQLWDND